jgi:hypothetical protein
MKVEGEIDKSTTKAVKLNIPVSTIDITVEVYQ